MDPPTQPQDLGGSCYPHTVDEATVEQWRGKLEFVCLNFPLCSPGGLNLLDLSRTNLGGPRTCLSLSLAGHGGQVLQSNWGLSPALWSPDLGCDFGKSLLKPVSSSPLWVPRAMGLSQESKIQSVLVICSVMFYKVAETLNLWMLNPCSLGRYRLTAFFHQLTNT